MIKLSHDIIGLGLYAPSEAARYARISSQKFSRWVFGTSTAKPVIDPQLGRNRDERLATFIDLAQTLSIHDVRKQIRIPLDKIREGYVTAKRKFGFEYPFAMRHGAFVFGDLSDPSACHIGIYVSKDGVADAEEVDDYISRLCVQITGKGKGNLLIQQVVQDFSKRLEFGEDGVASRYEMFRKGRYSVVIDKDVRFGKPYIEEVGFEALTLAEAAMSEGSIDRAAKSYDVPREAVAVAVEFEKLINSRANISS